MRSALCLSTLLLISLSAAGARAQRAAPNAAPADQLATQRWSTGRGAPKATIVFLHGLGCRPDDAIIQRITGELQRRGHSYKVVSPWLRPAKLDGEEVVPDGLHTMSDQLRRARQTIGEQQGRVVLMGHSFGGKAALQLAREYPDKVACVVTLAPAVNMLYSYWKALTGERGLPADQQLMKRRIEAASNDLSQQLQLVRRPGDRKAAKELAGQLNYSRTMLDLVSFDEARVEAGAAKPTLHLHGTADDAVSIHYARRFAEQSPLVQLHEIEGADHGFLIGGKEHTAPRVDRAMGDAITRFLDAQLGPQPR